MGASFRPHSLFRCLSLAIACLGIRRFRVRSGRMIVNDHQIWWFDSNWLFVVSLVLGGFALLYAIWKKWRSQRVAFFALLLPSRLEALGTCLQMNDITVTSVSAE